MYKRYLVELIINHKKSFCILYVKTFLNLLSLHVVFLQFTSLYDNMKISFFQYDFTFHLIFQLCPYECIYQNIYKFYVELLFTMLKFQFYRNTLFVN
jgi:hypothetical protein